jgi:hypothetical protein
MISINNVKNIRTTSEKTALCVPIDATSLLEYVFDKYDMPVEIELAKLSGEETVDYVTRKKTYAYMTEHCDECVGTLRVKSDDKNMQYKILTYHSIILISKYDVNDLLEFCVNVINDDDMNEEYDKYVRETRWFTDDEA